MVKSYRISKDCFSSACEQHMEESPRRATGHALFDHPISLLSTQPVSIVSGKTDPDFTLPDFRIKTGRFPRSKFRTLIYRVKDYMILHVYDTICYDVEMIVA